MVYASLEVHYEHRNKTDSTIVVLNAETGDFYQRGSIFSIRMHAQWHGLKVFQSPRLLDSRRYGDPDSGTSYSLLSVYKEDGKPKLFRYDYTSDL